MSAPSRPITTHAWHAPDSSWASSEPIRRTMQHNRGRDTKPEMAIRTEVHRRGLRYRVNQRPVRKIPRTADLVFTRAHVAVFVDGCFWHGCPDHFQLPARNREYWEPKLAANVTRDRETDALLAAEGWTVIRIWEHDVVVEAATRVEEVVRGVLPAAPGSGAT